MPSSATPATNAEEPLPRSLGPFAATALNVSNMIGAGPFITIPLFISAMGGPQAMIGWVVAALLVTCDGLVWSELGAALPGSGGTYHFLREILGRGTWGRLVTFLFIWQFMISGTLELASGYAGVMPYLEYAFPELEPTLERWHIPGGAKSLACVTAIFVSLALCRGIRQIGWLGLILCGGTLATAGTIIVAGICHFDASLLRPPEGAFRPTFEFAQGLGGAMLIAVYDYLGYYNICHLGDETRDPGRVIPRAVLGSIALVATLYLAMNASIIAVVPWQEAMRSPAIVAIFMERLFGRELAVAFTWLIVWTVLACVFAMTLGYSRIPWAAARGGDFFPIFARRHPTRGYPSISLLAIGLLTGFFCYFELGSVINAAVAVRILVQFIGQIFALH